MSIVRSAVRRVAPTSRRRRLTAFALDRLNRRALILAGLGIALATLVVLLTPLLFSGSKSSSAPLVPTALARVVRTNVIERQQVAGTLAYTGSYAVATGATGVVTFVPSAGAVVERGHSLYELDRQPVTLFYGDRPAFRDFTFGMSAGPDVRALKENLRALGFSARGTLTMSNRFDLPTLVAVEDWQRARGLPASGAVSLANVVFLPGPVRINTLSASLGANLAAGAPVLSGTATKPAVLVPLDPGSVSQLKVGDHVLVTMPDNSTVPGHVAAIGRVASAPSASDQGGGQPSTPTIPVTVALNRRSQSALDQAPVQVAITAQEDRNVLAVPISALLAQPGGGYAVEMTSGHATRLVTVATGLFDDVAGRVEVSGPGLRAGMHVEVPAG